jgi:hypothetical protein
VLDSGFAQLIFGFFSHRGEPACLSLQVVGREQSPYTTEPGRGRTSETRPAV